MGSPAAPNQSTVNELARAPLCTAFDPQPKKPRITLPPLACDTHAHVCGPAAKYAYFPERLYTPPDCLLPCA